MKRLVILGVVIIGLAITAIVHVNIKANKADNQSVIDNQSIANISTTTDQVNAKPIAHKADLPLYAGQPINFIGHDPIINQYPKEVVEKQTKFLAEVAEFLKTHPGDFDSWVGVGIHKKFFNNFSGARDAWEYAKLLSPETVLPYLNLANLYAYYLNDFKKAELNYLAATTRDFNNIYGSYYATANFYRDFGFKDRAIEIYKKILELKPQDKVATVEIERLNNSTTQ